MSVMSGKVSKTGRARTRSPMETNMLVNSEATSSKISLGPTNFFQRILNFPPQLGGGTAMTDVVAADHPPTIVAGGFGGRVVLGFGRDTLL